MKRHGLIRLLILVVMGATTPTAWAISLDPATAMILAPTINNKLPADAQKLPTFKPNIVNPGPGLDPNAIYSDCVQIIGTDGNKVQCNAGSGTPPVPVGTASGATDPASKTIAPATSDPTDPEAAAAAAATDGTTPTDAASQIPAPIFDPAVPQCDSGLVWSEENKVCVIAPSQSAAKGDIVDPARIDASGQVVVDTEVGMQFDGGCSVLNAHTSTSLGSFWLLLVAAAGWVVARHTNKGEYQ